MTRKPPSERTLSFRVTNAEAAAIKARADAANLSVSDYLRATSVTPAVAATYQSLSTQIEGLQAALSSAQSFLAPKGKNGN
jgi:hypothetical protein